MSEFQDLIVQHASANYDCGQNSICCDVSDFIKLVLVATEIENKLIERDRKLTSNLQLAVEALKAIQACYQDCSVTGAIEIANRVLKEIGEGE